MSSNVPIVKPQSRDIIATEVSFEAYLEQFDGIHCELVGGNVIKMSPASLRHQNLLGYLLLLLSTYFEFRPIGTVIQQPFVQRLPNVEAKREPDLMVVLKTNPHPLRDTYMDGPADICIEIVSPDSQERDREEKFGEYQKGGVGEYWIFDILEHETLFYRLNRTGLYEPQLLDPQGNYHTPALPGLVVHVPTLWKDSLPGPAAVVKAMQAMLK